MILRVRLSSIFFIDAFRFYVEGSSIVLTTGVVLRRLATIPKLEAVSNSAKMGYSQTGFLLLSIVLSITTTSYLADKLPQWCCVLIFR